MEEVYSHYGKPADVWKHLTLCEVIRIEKPSIYIESNSACAEYTLSYTPEQHYGICTFIGKSHENPLLQHSLYSELERVAVKKNKYIGSPGLAMRVLAHSPEKYIFFDIQHTPLDNIAQFAKDNLLTYKVVTHRQDSIQGVLNLLDTLPVNTLIHIDPYTIDQPSETGYDYMDVFTQATARGLKCFLWYGFNTLNEKKYLNEFISCKLHDNVARNCTCTELIMDIIQPDAILCNPGILGSGLLTGNLSETSVSAVLNYTQLLKELYRNTHYKDCKGSMYMESICFDRAI